ncbi:hypothetical protein GH733_016556 [Mirounga leonina]|nr:hypothetical protein GH733_016556 [Mirounga leonina]
MPEVRQDRGKAYECGSWYWRKSAYLAVSVTLDPESSHPDLAVSDEKTSMIWMDMFEDIGETYSILGCELKTSL